MNNKQWAKVLGFIGASSLVVAVLSVQYSGSKVGAIPSSVGLTSVQPDQAAITLGRQASLSDNSQPLNVDIEIQPIATPRQLPNAFAPSLEGTDIDGQLKLDAAGNLVVDLEVKDFFDYFLNTVGEVTPDVAVAEMQQVAASYLPPSAVDQAMKLLGEYLAYKSQAVELMAQPMLPIEQQTKQYQIDMLEMTFQTLKSIRRETMSEEAVTAFFTLEEAYGEYTLATIRVQNDETLSVDEKLALTQFYREQLPAIVRKTEETVLADADKHQVIHQAITSGNEETLRQQLADDGYDEDVAAEIVAFQSQQRLFDQRYQAYLLEKRQLVSAGLTDEDQTYQLGLLRARYFSNEKELTQAKVRDLKHQS
ncbi:lipase secretion chaperone [Alkalimarinus alittae]|uniref:Lipase chaperone n=1 Tax=Alkalimarinus alittae TaxID=2961619 RepID=A0ABY6N1Y0_9ALTE|nr:lipase secretion chaperone [Alkalimarinus alittae]UZE96040.1 hypothetical protein NKI27_18645 [Alkalimarinus alittae]